MATPSRYVATIDDQTFVIDGAMTLDDVFEHVAKRVRGGSIFDLEEQRLGTHKIFNLKISRDESAEPTVGDSIHVDSAADRQPANA
jgi:hypothetical protein